MTAVEESVSKAWRINCRATAFLVERLPAALWPLALPGSPRRTVRGMAVHLHDGRCLWMKSLARGTEIAVPRRLGRGDVPQADVLAALATSGEALQRLFEAAFRNGGRFPGVASAFVYGAMPRDAVLFCGYALSHEAHHRGQLVLAARALGHRLPPETVQGLWQWSSRLRDGDT
jgi:uncharacterized damage-inducible protein DinB